MRILAKNWFLISSAAFVTMFTSAALAIGPYGINNWYWNSSYRHKCID